MLLEIAKDYIGELHTTELNQTKVIENLLWLVAYMQGGQCKIERKEVDRFFSTNEIASKFLGNDITKLINAYYEECCLCALEINGDIGVNPRYCQYVVYENEFLNKLNQEFDSLDIHLPDLLKNKIYTVS